MVETTIDMTTDVIASYNHSILDGIKSKINRIIACQEELNIDIIDISTLVDDFSQLQRIYLFNDGRHDVVLNVLDQLKSHSCCCTCRNCKTYTHES